MPLLKIFHGDDVLSGRVQIVLERKCKLCLLYALPGWLYTPFMLKFKGERLILHKITKNYRESAPQEQTYICYIGYMLVFEIHKDF